MTHLRNGASASFMAFRRLLERPHDDLNALRLLSRDVRGIAPPVLHAELLAILRLQDHLDGEKAIACPARPPVLRAVQNRTELLQLRFELAPSWLGDSVFQATPLNLPITFNNS